MIDEAVTHALLVTGSRTWDDEPTMRRVLNEAWTAWLPGRIERPVLISGHARDGADAMAERLWREAGFDVMAMPADWERHGRRAGVMRNQEMVDAAVQMRASGVSVLCAAFLDPCDREGCPRRDDEQLAPTVPGHFSHGTAHCRRRAMAAGLPTIDAWRRRN